MTKEELIAFEADIAERFNRGEIRAPIHLEGGSEDSLIEIFKDVRRGDWVLCSWRSHLKALLHGVPPALVKSEIMAGRSIALCFPEYRFLSSAIVGGTIPIALGIALGIKRGGGNEKVWCWTGDMTALTGTSLECSNYARWHDLPVVWVTEDNGISVMTETRPVWGGEFKGEISLARSRYYKYQNPWPHSGAGKRVEF